MTERQDLERNPQLFDLFRVLRELERSSPDKPRIGDGTTVAQEVVALAQDPFAGFAASNITRIDATARGTPRVFTQFMGYFGPQGALPLNTTLDALNWLQRDPSFARFADLFANRFQQLFFRAWADSRPIAHHDRPREDKFARYVGAFSGIGTPAATERDAVPDLAKLAYSGLVSSRVKSARRLAQLLRGTMGLDVWIVERVGAWLTFEPDARTSLGARGSSLGQDTVLGTRAYSINDKFRILLKAESLEQYNTMLPGGEVARKIADLVFYYAGHRFEYDVELQLPAKLAPAARLGVSGQLGWTAWVAPPPVAADDDHYLDDARFDLSQRRSAGAL
ncbi:type VI secretion system baseplate subunit TssG [Devosia sp. Root635]|uniref:type VI secretion system baseplate subunit TssG n=1 Tax=Devosia sp. Root635 TaxID=1736575 RepID=UPI0006F59C16|nr:type VI secretion system baseplate subunit TssG [Devosia sp. Root635]KRA53081.1 hypothetical protein ASD80_13905 [Devosia sp. Root635]